MVYYYISKSCQGFICYYSIDVIEDGVIHFRFYRTIFVRKYCLLVTIDNRCLVGCDVYD